MKIHLRYMHEEKEEEKEEKVEKEEEEKEYDSPLDWT